MTDKSNINTRVSSFIYRAEFWRLTIVQLGGVVNIAALNGDGYNVKNEVFGIRLFYGSCTKILKNSSFRSPIGYGGLPEWHLY